MPKPTKPRKRLHERKSVRVSVWIIAIGSAFFVAMGLIVPRIASWQARKMTGRSFRFGFLVISPNGRVSVSARGGQQLNQNFHLDAAQARFDWWNVLLKRIRVGYVDFKDARFEIEKNAAGELIVNGVNLAHLPPSETQPKSPAPQTEEKPSKPWGLGLGRFSLERIDITYRSPDLNADLLINRLIVGKTESWRPEHETPFEADLTLNGSRVLIIGTLTPFSDAMHAKADIKWKDFPLKSIASLTAKSNLHEWSGLASLGGQLDFLHQKPTGTWDLKWLGDVRVEKASMLYRKPPKEKNGFEKKFRFGLDGIMAVKHLKLHSEKNGGQSTLVYSIDEIKNRGVFRMNVRDESFRRAPVFRLDPFDFNLKNITTVDVTKPLVFDLKASLGKYDRFSSSGKITPFAKLLNGEIETKLKEFDLTPFTAYAEHYSGSRIQTGTLGLISKATIVDDQLDAHNKVLLKKLEFQYINKEKEEERTGKVGIPSNVMLALLKDKNGDIILDVPMTGPARDPNFGFGPLMAKLTAKALSMAAQKAATMFFPPLKTIQLIGSGIAFAMKWRFEPLVFETGTLQLTPESEAYAAAVGEKLQERPRVRLTVCGVGTRWDLTGKKGLPTEEDKSKKEPPPLSDKQRDRLIQLGIDRAAFIKDFFITRYSIDSERLLLCTPDIDDAELAIPRGTLSL